MKAQRRKHRSLYLERLELRQLLTTYGLGGRVQWTDGAGGLHPVPLATVEAYEKIGASEQLLGSTTTNLAGHYNLELNIPPQVRVGTPDVFVRVLADSAVAKITPTAAGASTYAIDSSVLVDIPENASSVINVTAGNATDKETAFSIHHALIVISQYAGNLAGVSPSKIDVRYDAGVAGSFFRSSTKELFIRGSAKFEWDVIHHEFGHYFQSIHKFEANPGGKHSFLDHLSNVRGSKAIGLPLAWGEGWPSFFAISGQQSVGAAALGIPEVGDGAYQSFGGGINLSLESDIGVGEDNELSIMNTLWDLYDAVRDGADETTLTDRRLFTIFKDAGVTTIGGVWEALAAAFPSTNERVRIAGIFSQNKIAPELLGPADNALISETAPTFNWRKNGGGNFNPLNDFRIRFYSSDFSKILFEKEVGDTDTYTPTAEDWTNIRSENGLVKWVVEGRNQTSPASPGGTLGYYWSGARTLGSIPLILVIDDTGSMGEEIAGVRDALRQYIDLVETSIPAGEKPPTIQLMTFKDSVSIRATSNDLNVMRGAVDGLAASGGGDCPEFSAQALALAADNISPGGTILLATDASTQPGVDMSAVLTRLRSKGVTVNTILSGDCEPIGSRSDAASAERGPAGSAASTLEELGIGKVETAGLSEASTLSRGSLQEPTLYVGPDTEEDPPHGPIDDPGQPPIDDHGNTADEATRLIIDSNYVLGTVGLTGDSADLFRFRLDAGIRYTVQLRSDGFGFGRAELLHPETGQVLGNTFLNGGQIFVTPTETMDYLLRVTSTTASSVQYEVRASSDPLLGVTSAVELFSTVAAQTGGVFTLRDEVNSGNSIPYTSAIFNVLASTLEPTVLSASPRTVPRGVEVSVTLTGRNTNWRAGETSVSFGGTGISVQSVEVLSATMLSAVIRVDPAAELGFVDTTVSSSVGGNIQNSIGRQVLEITPAVTSPTILSVDPADLTQGTTSTVVIRGTNVDWNASISVSLGSGITVKNVRVVSPTILEVSAETAASASIGFRTVEVTQGSTSTSSERALFVNPAGLKIPQIISLDQDSADAGEELSVRIRTENIELIPGQTSVSFGDGIEVLSVTVNAPNEALARIRLATTAAVGFRSVSITSQGVEAVLLRGFYVDQAGMGNDDFEIVLTAPLAIGSNRLEIHHATPGQLVTLVRGTRMGASILHGVPLGIADGEVIAQGVVQPDGRAHLLMSIASVAELNSLLMQAYERGPVLQVSPVFSAAGLGAPAGGEEESDSAARLDVNRDGRISAIDALMVINSLNRSSSTMRLASASGEESASRKVTEDRRLDVSGDGRYTALDALLVINYLNRREQQRFGEGEGSGSRRPQSASAPPAQPIESGVAFGPHIDEDLLVSIAADAAAAWEGLDRVRRR